jgi:hypothetical protein
LRAQIRSPVVNPANTAIRKQIEGEAIIPLIFALQNALAWLWRGMGK